MLIAMSDKDTNDLSDEVGEIVTRNIPQFITVIIAICGIIAAYFMTLGDMKVKDMELQQRVSYLEQKVDHIQTTMDNIKEKLDDRIPVVDQDREDLHKEIEGLKDVLSQMKPYLKK
jgi:uncharacterized coiled-coil protein SlyX